MWTKVKSRRSNSFIYLKFEFYHLFSNKIARTFGHHLFKRLSFAIIPTAFIVGIIITLLAALTIVSVKSLGVGVRYRWFHCNWAFNKKLNFRIYLQIILLIIAIGQILARTFQAAPLAPLPVPQFNAPVPLVYQRPGEPVWFDK